MKASVQGHRGDVAMISLHALSKSVINTNGAASLARLPLFNRKHHYSLAVQTSGEQSDVCMLTSEWRGAAVTADSLQNVQGRPDSVSHAGPTSSSSC